MEPTSYLRMHNVFKKSTSHLEMFGTRRITRTLRMENPQILGTTLENLVATVIWHLGFVHLCVNPPRQISRIREEIVNVSDSQEQEQD
jgi:hypothetical protein